MSHLTGGDAVVTKLIPVAFGHTDGCQKMQQVGKGVKRGKKRDSAE